MPANSIVTAKAPVWQLLVLDLVANLSGHGFDCVAILHVQFSWRLVPHYAAEGSRQKPHLVTSRPLFIVVRLKNLAVAMGVE